MKIRYALMLPATICAVLLAFTPVKEWESAWVKKAPDGTLRYKPDSLGNTIPDFSLVGFGRGMRGIPNIGPDVMIRIKPGPDAADALQLAIDALSKKPMNKEGYRGTILIEAGTYHIPGSVRINASGIVLRGEGAKTVLVATGTDKRPLIHVSGSGAIVEVPGTRSRIIDTYVPIGSKSFRVIKGSQFKVGQQIILYRPGTEAWIHDLKMDRIVERKGTKQWTPQEYDFTFERSITGVQGDVITIDNPVVMPMEEKYGGGYIYEYKFEGRIRMVGIENMHFRSEFTSDTAENHSWDAIRMNKVSDSWVRNVEARHFAYSCVNLENTVRNVTVMNAGCYDHKSVITGGRRYSFNNDGQLNLFINCKASDGRHDFVTGARVHGPNVFYNCSATRTHADIGPHHRWAMGTLYDNITTDGEINVQDRGNMGSGHGWVGTTQILWNCKVKRAAVQNPYVHAFNFAIGVQGQKAAGHFKDRNAGTWEGHNQEGLTPSSLYQAQVDARYARSKMLK